MFCGCFPDMTPPKSVLKLIKKAGLELEWFSFSSAYAVTPDVITVASSNRVDTICRSTNIRDIKVLQHNVLLISFCGTPKRYDEEILLPEKISGITIVIDTTCSAKFVDIAR